ncbi:MAG: tRNA guanosine(34) transglycosylase Tgt [Chloroflexi bacterium]|nr:tRNA guanosine(34) transglycosylase Tgt [Chloroflexota bacterium]
MQANQFLNLPHGRIKLPAFLPDGTLGVVRAVDSTDLAVAQIQALVMNIFHLMQRPGSSTIQALGGLHNMSAWDKPIITDSGGFQAYSLIRENPKSGTLSDRGIVYRREVDGRKFQLTPEKSVQLQVSYGSDVVICLDEPTHIDEDHEAQRMAVERTVRWAQRCKDEFERLLDEKAIETSARPLLFGVIQGGGSQELRKQCADQLLEIGFDGYGYGGWPLDSDGRLLTDVLAYTHELVPTELPFHALGVGHPENVAACVALGYMLFDSALPTRDARRGRLFTFTASQGLGGKWFKYLYINDEEHIKHTRPISEHCDCPTCSKYSRGYLHHLFKINDHLYHRLATLHNLRFMTLLEDRLRQKYA